MVERQNADRSRERGDAPRCIAHGAKISASSASEAQVSKAPHEHKGVELDAGAHVLLRAALQRRAITLRPEGAFNRLTAERAAEGVSHDA